MNAPPLQPTEDATLTASAPPLSSAPPVVAPKSSGNRARLEELFAAADIQIDGPRPWDPKVTDARFFDRVFAGSLAIGEAYMDGMWDCDQIDELVCRFRRARLDARFRIGSDGWRVLKARLRNMQSPSPISPVTEQASIVTILAMQRITITVGTECEGRRAVYAAIMPLGTMSMDSEIVSTQQRRNAVSLNYVSI